MNKYIILAVIISIIIVIVIGYFLISRKFSNFKKKMPLKKIKKSPSPPKFRVTSNIKSLDKLYVYYINLINREDRKEKVVSELKKVGFPSKNITRIDAFKVNDGGVGCTASHIAALSAFSRKKLNVNKVMIVEDDLVWNLDYKEVNEILYNIMNDSKEDYPLANVLLLGCIPGREFKLFQKVNNNFIKTATNDVCQTTTGYIIKKDYIPKLLKLWVNSLGDNINGIDQSQLDQSWKKLQKKDKWLIAYNTKKDKVLAVQNPGYSDILNKKTNYLFVN